MIYGGTRLGDAIRVMTAALSATPAGVTHEVFLITDGEDQDSQPLEAAQAAADKGIVIHTVGIGDPAGVPLKLRQNAGRGVGSEETIVSKLDEETLKVIAEITQGVYLPAQTKRLDFGRLYSEHITPRQAKAEERSSVKIWKKFYHIPAWISLALLMLAWSFDERRPQRRLRR